MLTTDQTADQTEVTATFNKSDDLDNFVAVCIEEVTNLNKLNELADVPVIEDPDSLTKCREYGNYTFENYNYKGLMFNLRRDSEPALNTLIDNNDLKRRASEPALNDQPQSPRPGNA